MATATIPLTELSDSRSQQFLLRGVDWPTYQTISNALKGRHLRLTYEHGNLELLNVCSTRGNLSRLIGRFLFVLAEEFQLPLRSFGDMTCDREDLDRGVEPDECFYLVNEPLIRDKKDFNLQSDPPPDLVIEIDISRSSRNRSGIYQALGVPEIWQFDGEELSVHQQGERNSYGLSATSRFFPGLPMAQLAAFLGRRTETEEVTLVRAFRTWVQGQSAI